MDEQESAVDLTAAKESATGSDGATAAADVAETAVLDEAESDAAPAANDAVTTDASFPARTLKRAEAAPVTAAVITAVTSTATVSIDATTSVASQAVSTDVSTDTLVNGTVPGVGDTQISNASSADDAVEPAADIVEENLAILSQKTIDSAYVSAVTGTHFEKTVMDVIYTACVFLL